MLRANFFSLLFLSPFSIFLLMQIHENVFSRRQSQAFILQCFFFTISYFSQSLMTLDTRLQPSNDVSSIRNTSHEFIFFSGILIFQFTLFYSFWIILYYFVSFWIILDHFWQKSSISLSISLSI